MKTRISPALAAFLVLDFLFAAAIVAVVMWKKG
jgi:hypothetical protein